jgi:hypothetical protein
VLKSYFKTNQLFPVNFVLGQTNDLLQLPQVAVQPGEADEEVFHTAIYRVKMAVTARTDLDVGTTSDMRQLFAAITDCFQQDTLVTQLNNTGLVVVRLVICGSQSLQEHGDRYIEKTANYEVLGYSVQSGITETK